MPACSLNRIIFDPTLARIAVGGTLALTALGLDLAGTVQHATAFTWASDNTAIATTSAAGVITAVKRGKCNITATSGSITGSILIEVGVKD